MEIPQCNERDYSKEIEMATKEVLDGFAWCKKCGWTSIHAQINTCNSATGGYAMPVIRAVAKMFAEKGWFVYLVTGGAYRNPSRLEIKDYEDVEGYTNAKIPSYYQRIR